MPKFYAGLCQMWEGHLALPYEAAIIDKDSVAEAVEAANDEGDCWHTNTVDVFPPALGLTITKARDIGRAATGAPNELVFETYIPRDGFRRGFFMSPLASNRTGLLSRLRRWFRSGRLRRWSGTWGERPGG